VKLRRELHVSLAFELQHFNIFPYLHDIDPVLFFLQRGILWVLWWRGITLATLMVLTPISSSA